MPQIQLRREQLADPGIWPAYCLRCGQPTEDRVPLPRSHTKEQIELAVPLCERHADHWQRYKKASRIGIVLVLLFLALVVPVVWHFVGPRHPERGLDMDRIGFTMAISASLFIPFCIGVAFTVGSLPIEISEVTPNRVTLTGISREFLRLWTKEGGKEQLPPLAQEARMQAYRFKPDGGCPYPGVLHLFLFPLALAVLFGTALAGAAQWFAGVTANWNANDSRYVALIAGVLLVYGILILIVTKTPPNLLVIFGIVCALAAIVLTGCATIVFWFRWTNFSNILFFALNLPALVILMVVIDRSVGFNRIRHAFAGGLAGVLTPLALAGSSVLLSGGWDGPQGSLYIVGPIFAVIGLLVGSERAQQPYCTSCDNWMEQSFVGVLGWPRSEVEPILSRGELVRLVEAPVQKTADPGDVELAMFHCTQCRELSTVVIELTEVYKNNKNNPQRRAAGSWVYPGLALHVVDEMFPPQHQEHVAEGEKPTV